MYAYSCSSICAGGIHLWRSGLTFLVYVLEHSKMNVEIPEVDHQE